MLATVAAAAVALSFLTPRPIKPVVEKEETVYTYKSADNGAGPFWCYGSTCIARVNDNVFVSGIETLEGAKPLNNVRWTLYREAGDGWRLLQCDPSDRTREPCPLAVIQNGSLFMSVNPTLTPRDTYNGPSEPRILRFDIRNPGQPPTTRKPRWEGNPKFTEHSYRGFCADGKNRELLLFNILGHEAHYWSFMNEKGEWTAVGKLDFPIGVDYEKPEPIRLCYPQLALSKRTAYMLAVSDIIEPVIAWREFKLKLHNGNAWDYDFRRLFYAWTPDITKRPFCKPIEVANREKTAGHITNLDLWLDRSGRAHILWLDQSIWYPEMRDVFFKNTPITVSLEYAVIEKGVVVRRTTLAKGGEAESPETPLYGRFHATPDGRLFVFAAYSKPAENGTPRVENRLTEIGSDGLPLESVVVPLVHPLTTFMMASERGGSSPSQLMDVIGEGDGSQTVRYARIRLK